MPLTGWDDAKKYKVSIDHTKVDSTLTNFPVLLNLTQSGTGITNFDCTPIFEELEYFNYPTELDDDFTAVSGSAVNTDLWLDNDDSNIIISNNKLQMSITNEIVHRWVYSAYVLTGDFDIQVDFEFLSHEGATENQSIQLHVGTLAYVNDETNANANGYNIRHQYNAGSYDYNSNRKTAGSWGSQTSSGAVQHTTGKLRITRSGTNGLVYYHNGSSWTLLETYTSIFSDYLYIKLNVFTITQSDIVGTFDNFIVNSGSIYWPYSATYEGTDGNLPENVLDEEWWLGLLTSPAGGPELNDWKAEIDTNRFRMYQDVGQTVTETWVWYLNKYAGFKVSGDFDIEIYLEDYLRTGGGDTYMMFYIGGSYIAFAKYTTAGDKFVSTLVGDTWAAATRSSADGSLRLKRVGSALTSYYRNSHTGNWTQHRTGTDSSEKLAISVRSYLFQNSADTATSVDFYVNKIVINKGTITWADNRVPTRKNIALEYNNQHCYMEIEYWDQANKSAQLWAKIPTIASGTNTDLFLYYDSTTSGNTAYVGDTGDTPAQDVWDDNFVAVYHMAKYPNTTSGILNSVVDNYHGTPNGTMSIYDLVDGFPGKSIDFDGSDDYIDISDTDALDFDTSEDFTVDIAITDFTKPTDDYTYIFRKVDTDSPYEAYELFYDNRDASSGNANYRLLQGNVRDSSAVSSIALTTANPDGGGDYFISMVRSSDVLSIFSGGTKDDQTTGASGSLLNNGPLILGGSISAGSAYKPADVTIGEFRISSIARAAAWVKSTNYTSIDDLVTFDDAVKIYFSSANPDNITDYGFTSDLSLVVTVSGWAPTHAYDIDYYTDVEQQVGSTISGTDSGQSTTKELSTPSGIEYSWYVIATSSGVSDTSSTYTFDNRFLAAGTVETPEGPVSGTLVRLYRRVDGVLVDETLTTSTGTFSIDTPYPEEHYCIAFHEDTTYNALIYDHVEP